MSRILIIDEENISVRGIKYLIDTRVRGASYFVCKTCSSGLQELTANTYDLLILDMMLPTGDWAINIERPDNLYGLDLLEEIMKKHNSLNVICYTIIDDNYVIEKIKSLGAHYICKTSNNSRDELELSIKRLTAKPHE